MFENTSNIRSSDLVLHVQGIQDPSPSRALNTSKEERELQRLKTQAEKVKHREQKLAERKRVREQQDAEREEKKKVKTRLVAR